MGGGIYIPDSGDRIHGRTYHKLCNVCCSLISVNVCARLDTAAKLIPTMEFGWLIKEKAWLYLSFAYATVEQLFSTRIQLS
jgi:hypothetical protein